MKKVIAFGVILLGLFLLREPARRFGEKMTGSGTEKVRIRVDTMLQGWVKGGTGTSGEVETALCQWYKGALRIGDRDELSRASDGFDRFRKEKDLYREIKLARVLDISFADPETHELAIATVEIDGKKYKLKVVENRPIEWLE